MTKGRKLSLPDIGLWCSTAGVGWICGFLAPVFWVQVAGSIVTWGAIYFLLEDPDNDQE